MAKASLYENTKFKTLPLEQLFSLATSLVRNVKSREEKASWQVGDGFGTQGSSIGELTSSQEASGENLPPRDVKSGLYSTDANLVPQNWHKKCVQF